VRREAAAFYLSQIAQGLLAGEFEILTGHETTSARPTDALTLEIAFTRKPRADLLSVRLRWSRSEPGDASVSAERRTDRRARQKGRRVTQNLLPRHLVATPSSETLAWKMRMTSDTGEMTARRTGEGPARRPAARVLIAEDERDVAELIRYTLAREGFEVMVAANGADALRQAQETRPDLMLLDLMLPQVNGWELCRRLKQDPATRSVPVIMLTARSEEGDKVLGFELGADDYVTKPFSTRELVARVRAVVRRTRPPEMEERRHRIKVGDLVVDRQRFEVTVGGRAVALTPKEFELLATLAAEPGRVYGRDELLDLVWGRDGFVEPRTVDVHLARLRAKFVAARLPEPAIETVRGVGYRYRELPG
jgi:two-component system alkaline phosphatase synthesis response regulator PhoP